jgi:SurA-like N-terminal domain/PPIC-type PPIASE domain
MVIRKMNSVFARHGRILFGSITLVIIVSFLGLMTPGKLFPSNRGETVVGSAFDQEITVEDVQNQARDTAMVFGLQYGLNLPQIGQMAQSRAFPDLCQLAAAKQRGVRVSDEQVADAMSKFAKFQDPKTKKFDMEKYKEYVDGNLKKRDLRPSDLDHAVRNQLILQKLNLQIQESVIVTDGEIIEYFRMAAEKFEVMTARFNGIDLEKDIKLDEKKLLAYFEANKKVKGYVIPAKYQAMIIEFPYSKYLKAAAKSIKKADVVKYYENNKAEFNDTKGKPRPLTKVAAKIRKKIIDKTAKELAHRESQKFATALYEEIMDVDASEKYKIFEQAAQKANMKPVPSGEFSLPGGKLAGRWEEPELAKQISIAYNNAPISNPIPGKKGAYIGYRTSRIEERPAKFNEVKALVAVDYRREHAIRLAREKARALYVKLTKANAKDRKAIVKAAKAPAFKPLLPFSMQRPPMTSDGRMLLGAVKKLQANGIAPPQENVNGAVLVYLVKRTLPSDKEFDKSKDLVKKWYTQSKIRAAQVAFSAWVNTRCKQAQANQR